LLVGVENDRLGVTRLAVSSVRIGRLPGPTGAPAPGSDGPLGGRDLEMNGYVVDGHSPGLRKVAVGCDLRPQPVWFRFLPGAPGMGRFVALGDEV